jgi:(R)-2-hydroxyacyl-CoA dehydratese activating ATPase
MGRILGIDLGSRSVKIVLMENNNIVESKIIDTAKFYREFCVNSNGLRVDLFKIGIDNVDKIISTGYGRNNINFENSKIIQELKAHTYGAVWQTGLKDFILLDIGGQDSKAILIKNSKVHDIALNDKCAASCGRYLENMSNVLDINLDEMGLYFEDPIRLNSTCAIFSESELIGYISDGIDIKSLISGVNYSLFNRVKQLIERFDSNILVLSGGVALNKALVCIFKANMDFENIIIPKYPQLNGAIGCCAFGEKINV